MSKFKQQVDSAKDNIRLALSHLTEILVNGCEGTQQISQEYLQKIEKAFKLLLKAKKHL